MKKITYALIGLLFASSCAASDYKLNHSIFKTAFIGMGLFSMPKTILADPNNCPEPSTINRQETEMAQQNSIYAPTPFAIAKGGTGNSAALTNGQLWMGNTGNVPTPATITPGTNIGITNAAGSITVAATGPASWTTVFNSATSVLMSPWVKYINNAVSTVTFNLPNSAVLGDTYKIVSKFQSSFTIIRNGGPSVSTIYYNNNFGGRLTTTSLTAGITLVCILGGAAPSYSVEGTNGELFTLTPS